MPNNKNHQQIKEHFIYDPATKQRIPVSDEVYNEFYRPIWNTFRKAHRHDCCSCAGNKWWLCEGDCASCRFHVAGDSLSLDYEQEILGDIREDETADLDGFVIDRIIFEQLLKRLDELMPEARRIGELRLAGYTDSAIADIIGVPRTTFLYRIKKAEAQLREEYGDTF